MFFIYLNRMKNLLQKLTTAGMALSALGSLLVLSKPLNAQMPPEPPQDLIDFTDLTKDWIFVGTGDTEIGNTVDISNGAIGALPNLVPGPISNGATDTSTGLGFLSNIPLVPSFSAINGVPQINPGPSTTVEGTIDFGDPIVGILPPQQTFSYGAPIAVTQGKFDSSNVRFYSANESQGGEVPNFIDPGISCGLEAISADAGCLAGGNSNSVLFNNPTDTTNFSSLAVGNGITGEVGLQPLQKAVEDSIFIRDLNAGAFGAPISCQLELDNTDSFSEICSDNTLTLPDGQIGGDSLDTPTNLYVKLDKGFQIIDIVTNGNDLTMTNANFIVDGHEDSTVIFRIEEGAKFNINQGNILIGDMGIMNMNILFYSDTEDTSAFNFNDTVFNGTSFLAAADEAGAVVNNSQGCVQYLGDKLNFQNVDYDLCSYKAQVPENENEIEIPEPGTIFGLVGAVAAALGLRRRKSNHYLTEKQNPMNKQF